MIEYKRELPILNIKYSILIYDDPIEIFKKFEDVKFEIDPRDYQGGIFEIEGRDYIALLNDGKLTNGMIAHECKHFINNCFRYIGYNPQRDNDEMECYFLTYVVDQIDKIIKK